MHGIKESLENLKRAKASPVRKLQRISFGSKEQCKQLLIEAFIATDDTVVNKKPKNLQSGISDPINEFNWLPEYDNIIEWMQDNKGKGLCLRGDCGRGKSNIVCGVLPTLFMARFNKIIRPIIAEDIPDIFANASRLNKKGYEESDIGFIKNIFPQVQISIDELGTEPLCNHYSEKYEGFNRIINLAEKELRLLFISTNLNKNQLLGRYGVRTWERINRLCTIVAFKGDSFRK